MEDRNNIARNVNSFNNNPRYRPPQNPNMGGDQTNSLSTIVAQPNFESMHMNASTANDDDHETDIISLQESNTELSIHDDSWISWDHDAVPQVIFSSPSKRVNSAQQGNSPVRKQNHEDNLSDHDQRSSHPQQHQHPHQHHQIIKALLDTVERQSKLISDLENKVNAVESKMKLKVSKSELSAEVLRNTKVLHEYIASKCSTVDVQSLLEKKIGRNEFELFKQQTLTKDQVQSMIQDEVDTKYIHSLFDTHMREIHKIKSELEMFVVRDETKSQEIEKLFALIGKQDLSEDRLSNQLNQKVDREEVIVALNEQFEHIKNLKLNLDRCTSTVDEMSLGEIHTELDGVRSQFRALSEDMQALKQSIDAVRLETVKLDHLNKYALVEDIASALSQKVSSMEFDNVLRQVDKKADKKDVVLALRKKINQTEVDEIRTNLSGSIDGTREKLLLEIDSLKSKCEQIGSTIESKIEYADFDAWMVQMKEYLSLLVSREELTNSLQELRELNHHTSITLNWANQSNIKGRVVWNPTTTAADMTQDSPFNLLSNCTDIEVRESGIYEIRFGFYTYHKRARIDLLVNDEIVLSAAHPKSVQLLSDNSSSSSSSSSFSEQPPHPGTTGLTLIDYLYLPSNCTIHLLFSGQLTPVTTGFITINHMSL